MNLNTHLVKRPADWSRVSWSENARDLFCAGVLVFLVLFASGCGGGGSSASQDAAPVSGPAGDVGNVIITVTDAPADFLSYSVDVTSIKLVQANGTIVETVPLSTRIDFVELTEVSEFFTIATIPAGLYTEITMSMDYSSHEVVVEDETGNQAAANVVDVSGNPITTFTMQVKLPDSDVIRIRPGVPAHVSLDFDLQATNAVDLATAPPTVTVEPVLFATPELERDREHRIRGVLDQVNELESSITVNVRPFRHRLRDFGSLTFVTNAETRYEINGAAFVGSAGLAEMALHENIPVVAGVSINAERQPVAFTVLAGSSVPWTDGDVVHGVVAARSVDTLTIKGARVEFTDGTDVFRGEYEVLLGAGTEVLSILVSSDLLDNDSISVGQRVTVWGEILDDGTVDAAEGRIRMQVSSFTAEVTQASPLTADLFSLNGRDPGAYDFSGTGSTETEDADPDEYQVDTASLGLETIEIGDLVRVAGNVNAWGMAPVDFNAVTVIDIDTDMRGAHLFASWIEIGGSSTAFTSVDPGGIEVDLTAARRSLKLRGVPAEAVNLGDAIRLVAPADGGVWAVAVRDAGALQMYRDFAELADEIVSQLAAGNLLVRISASGRYNGADSELTSGRAIFVFVEPDSL